MTTKNAETNAVIVEHHDDVALVRLNRPHTRNALDPDIKAGLETSIPALMKDSAVRCLTIEGDGGDEGDRGDGGARQVLVGWDQAPSLPGYAEAFGIIDAVIRQLSGAAVGYPASQAAIVTGITGGLTHSSRSAP